jgi:hypothetical protein
MKTIKTLSLFVMMMCLFTVALQADPPVRATTPPTVKPMKLSPAATQTLNKWKTTKNMMLKKDGNFVPMAHNIPGGGMGPNSFADGGINCAKIPCPPVFGSDVTCWECQ